jgi:hypothetical protein
MQEGITTARGGSHNRNTAPAFAALTAGYNCTTLESGAVGTDRAGMAPHERRILGCRCDEAQLHRGVRRFHEPTRHGRRREKRHTARVRGVVQRQLDGAALRDDRDDMRGGVVGGGATGSSSWTVTPASTRTAVARFTWNHQPP